MKARYFGIGLCLIFLGFIYSNHTFAQSGKAAVTISESNSIYKFSSKFDKAKTKQLQRYMTESLKGTDFKFTNTQLDAELTLTGGINFYIRSRDGELAMKFDKRKNKPEDYTRFKHMCEGLRDIIQKN